MPLERLRRCWQDGEDTASLCTRIYMYVCVHKYTRVLLLYIYHAKGLSDAIDVLPSEEETNSTLVSSRLERIGVQGKCLSRIRRPLCVLAGR